MDAREVLFVVVLYFGVPDQRGFVFDALAAK
jgi:hypothetical protein